MKSIKDASRNEERENRQVCAGTFGSGAGTSWLHSAKSFPLRPAVHIYDLSVVSEVSALFESRITGFVITPLVQIVGVVEVGFSPSRAYCLCLWEWSPEIFWFLRPLCETRRQPSWPFLHFHCKKIFIINCFVLLL